MIKKLIFTLSICLLFGLLPFASHAGQLHVDYYGVVSVMQGTGIVIMGTVVAVNAAKGQITLLVKKVWARKDVQPEIQIGVEEKDSKGEPVTVFSDVPLEIGKEIQLDVYGGVEWTDPGKSPIDRRLFGARELGNVKPGQDYLYVGRELLPASKENLSRLDRVFSPTFKKDYPGKTTDSDLLLDLDDHELSKIAFPELIKRKKVSFRTLMSMKDESQAYELVAVLLDNQKDKSGAEVFKEAQVELLGPYPYTSKYTLIRPLVGNFKPERINDTATLLIHLLTTPDPHLTSEENGWMRKAVVDLASTLIENSNPHLSGKNVAAVGELYWATQIAKMAENKDIYLSAQLQTYLNTVPKDLHFPIINAGFATLPRLVKAGQNKLTDESKAALYALRDLVEKNPDKGFAGPTLNLPFHELKANEDKEVMMGAIIDMAVALAKKDPTVIAKMKPTVEKMLDTDLFSEPSTSTNDDVTFEIMLSVKLEDQINLPEFEDYKKMFRKK